MRIVTLTRPAPTPVVRPFNTGFWFDELPDNATIDPSSATAVTELVRQVSAYGTNLNSRTFTAEITVVPASQPLIPVTNTAGYAQATWCKLGLPIPDGWQPTRDFYPSGSPGDRTGIFYQPDYACPLDNTLRGRLYETFQTIQAADGSWSCGYAHRAVGVNNSPAVWSYSWELGPGGSQYATNPDSTYTDGYWTTGSGMALAPTLLTPEDCARGYADHALGLLVVQSGNPPVWPAMKTDGNTPGSVLHEGHRFRFPPGYQIPTGLHPIAQCVAQTAIRHGLCIVDQAGCVAVRATPSVNAQGYRQNTAEYLIFKGFPWGDLQLLSTNASQANPVPIS